MAEGDITITNDTERNKNCYENPLFEEESGRDGSRSTPKGNGTTKDYHRDPTLGQESVVQYKEMSKWKKRILYTFSLSLIAIATIAIIVTIIVAKGNYNGSQAGAKSEEEVGEKVLFRTRRMDGTLKIVQGPFSEFSADLQDISSVAYSYFSLTFIYQMNSIFKASDLKNVYSSTEILNISSGSVIVNFIIHLAKDVNVMSNTEIHITQLILEGMKKSLIILDWKSVKITAVDIYRPVIPTGQCEPLRLRTCINLTDYNITAFPNVLGHNSSQQAEEGMMQHIDLFADACYGYSTDFWCSVFNPECKRNTPIPPCKQYCEDVYNGCGDAFREKTSAILACSSLPDSDNPSICRQNPYRPGKCIPLTDPLCKNVGYTQIAFPNYASQISSMEVAPLLQLIAGIQEATHCYEHSVLLACSALMPKCSGTEQIPNHTIPPCSSLCKDFTERCAIFLDIFFTPWPPQVNCSAFPDEDDPNVCIGYKEAHAPPAVHSCDKEEITCDNDTCIPFTWRCDDYQDCQDNKDETPIAAESGFKDTSCAICTPETFSCSPRSKLCLKNSKLCDGFEDCPLGTDERECVQLDDGSRQGILSVYDGQTEQWSKVCANGWNNSWSQLVCNQLGFKNTISTSYAVDVTSGDRLVLGQMKTNAKDNIIQSYLLPRSSCGGDNVVSITCDNPVCGTRPAYFQPMTRIVGGDVGKPGAWPWLVALLGGSGEKYFCGGSIISEYWILTAGHCVGGRTDPTGLAFLIGQPRRLAYSRYSQVRHAKKIFLYPDYNAAIVDNDIALVQLDEPIHFNDHVRPVCLPTKNSVTPLGTRCTAAGWGKNSEEALDYERAIKQVDLQIVDTDDCREAILGAERKVPYQVNTHVICAGGGLDNDACSGDSGGPLLCRVNKTSDVWFVGGIVSWGVGCAYPNVPGVYTDVPQYIEWIETVTNLTFS